MHQRLSHLRYREVGPKIIHDVVGFIQAYSINNTLMESTNAASEERKQAAEWEVRCKLAMAYRIAHFYGWDQLIFNHITAKVPGSEVLGGGPHFLINPFGLPPPC